METGCSPCSPGRERSGSASSLRAKRLRRQILAVAPRKPKSRRRDVYGGRRARFGQPPMGVRVRVADVAAGIRLRPTMQGAVARLAEKPLRLLPCPPRLAAAAR